MTGQFSRGRADGQEILCLGDSLIKSGVDPRILEKNGITAFNLALGGGQAPGAYYLLKRLVDRDQCPRMVLFACHPKLLADPPAQNLDHWPFLLTIPECLDLGIQSGNLDLSARVLVHMLPSIRSRREIRKAIAPYLGAGSQDQAHWLAVAGQIYRNRGHLAFDYRLSETFDFPGWHKVFFDLPSVDPVNILYLDRMIELAQRHHIDFYWMVTPLMPEMQTLCDQQVHGVTIDRLLAAYQRKYPSIRVLDFRRSGFSESLFSDPHHLNSKGTIALSNRLVDALESEAQSRGASVARRTVPPASTIKQ